MSLQDESMYFRFLFSIPVLQEKGRNWGKLLSPFPSCDQHFRVPGTGRWVIHCMLWCLPHLINVILNMMTSSNGNIFRVTGHLRGEFTGPRWIPHTKTSEAKLWCFQTHKHINNGEAGDLRRSRAHYEVIVMICHQFCDFWRTGKQL